MVDRVVRWNVFPPKAISRSAFNELLSFLKAFKHELNPIDRRLSVRVVGETFQLESVNDEAPAVLEQFALSEIRELEIKLFMRRDEARSVEALIRITNTETRVSVSDDADWGVAVKEGLVHFLKSKKLVSGYFWVRLSELLRMLTSLFLIFGATGYLIWRSEESRSALLFGAAFGIAGILVLANEIYKYFKSSKPFMPVVESKLPRKFSIMTLLSAIATAVGTITGILELIQYITTALKS